MVLVAADAIVDVDVTAADVLVRARRGAAAGGGRAALRGLKGPVKDGWCAWGCPARFDAGHYEETVGSAVNRYRERFGVDWKDWDES